MNSKTFWLLAVLLLTSFQLVNAQQAVKIPRIGFLDPSTASGSRPRLEAFQQEMRKLGWIDGKNIIIEYRFAEQDIKRLPELVASLLNLGVDIVVAAGASAALAAKSATSTIPIVVTVIGDPLSAGLVASLAKPGGNVTGLSSLSPELTTKRLEVLKDAVPNLVRVGIIRPASGGIGGELQLKEMRTAALALKLKTEEITTQLDTKGVEDAFESAKQKQVNAITTLTGPRIFAARKPILEQAAKYRFPSIYFQREFVAEGGLMSYGADYDDLYRRAAVYVDKILKGAKPADLPVQQPTKFEFIINLKAAKEIELKMPVRVLERANQVIR